MESLLGAFAMFGFIIIGVVIVIYVLQAIFLNKFNKLVNGKGTALAWIPICNVYLLGKLTVNKLVGWILVICVFLNSTITTEVNGVEKSYNILPESISSIVSSVYGIVVLALFIYAIVKYNKLKKNANNVMNQPQQPMPQESAQPQMVQQPMPQQNAQPQMVQQPMPQQPQNTQIQPQQPMPQQNVQPQMTQQPMPQESAQPQMAQQPMPQQPMPQQNNLNNNM